MLSLPIELLATLCWLLPALAAPIAIMMSKFTRMGTGLFSCLISTLVLMFTILLYPLAIKNGFSVSFIPPLLFWVDGLSWLFMFITSLIGFFCLIYSLEYMTESLGRYYFWMLLFIASMNLLVEAENVLLFYASWELVTLCSYSLINFKYVEEKAEKAAYKVILMVISTGLLLLLGLLSLSIYKNSLEIKAIIEPPHTGKVPWWLSLSLLAILIGIFTKSVQTPLFTWLPDAMEAPTPVSAFIHAATMVKAGVYAAARLYPLFIFTHMVYAFLGFGMVTMILGSLWALAQVDAKRLLAYSTISHIGYIFTGFGFGTPLGIIASFYHLLNHALFKALLFLGIGAVEKSTGTKNLDELGGLRLTMPATASFFTLAALSLIGIPPLNGFSSKWMIYEAGIEAGIWWTALGSVVAMLTTSIAVIYSLKVVHATFFGLLPERLLPVKERGLAMLIPMGMLAVSCILTGVYPQGIVALFLAPVSSIITQVTVKPELLGYWINTAIGGWVPLLSWLIALTGLTIGFILSLMSKPLPIGESRKLFLCGEDEIVLPRAQAHVTGTHFLLTEFLERIKGFYKGTDFDKAYYTISRTFDSFCRFFAKTHSGKLWMYMLWVFTGFLIIWLLLLLLR